MAQPSLSDQMDRISALFEERMRIKGPDLRRQVYKAGRKLPRRVRRAAGNLLMVRDLIGHPKLSRQINESALRRDAALILEHLEAIDPRQERIGRILAFLAKVSTVLILGFVLVVWYLWSRGLV